MRSLRLLFSLHCDVVERGVKVFFVFVEQMTKTKVRIKRYCVKSSTANIESKNTVAKVSRRQQCVLLDSSSKHEN